MISNKLVIVKPHFWVVGLTGIPAIMIGIWHIGRLSIATLGWLLVATAIVVGVETAAFVDPLDVHWLGSPLEWSRSAIYTVAFFAFWVVSTIGALMTVALGRSASDLNGGIVSSPLPE